MDINESQLRIVRQVSNWSLIADVPEYMKDTPNKYDHIQSFDLVEHLKKDEVLEFSNLC